MIIASSYPYTGNGLGGLPDAVEAVVSHEINGIYELMFRYPVTGLHYDELISGRIVMAAPDDLTDEQPFRIYRITKPLNGIVTVYARHLCYDMQGIVVEPFTASDLTTAFQTIPTKCEPVSPITLQTTRTVATSITLSEPRPLWRLIGGQAGSLLDVYGGEWDFDKDVAKLVTQLGTDRGVNIRYGKNLTELEQDASIESCYSDVYPYWYYKDTNTLATIPEKTVAVVGSIVSNRVFVLDCSDDFDTQPSAQDLRDRANAYITANSIGNIKASWKISLVDTSENSFDKVMLGDILHVYYERLDVNATARAVKTEFDVLQNRYKSITVGRVKQNLASIIAQQNETIENAPTQSDLEKAQEDATDFIRNGQGYMRFIYNSNDELTEIVSLDDPDISQAQSVWRWNNGGFGHSSNGYSGTYSVAITQSGSIVADFVNTGTLNANVIRAGILQDALGKNSWNLATGAFSITNGSINITTNSLTEDAIWLKYGDNETLFNPYEFRVVDRSIGKAARVNAGSINMWENFFSPQIRMRSTYSQDGMALYDANGTLLFSGIGSQLYLYNSNNAHPATVYLYGYDNNNGGVLELSDASGTLRQKLDGNGKLWQYDANGKKRTYLEYGDIFLYNSSEKQTVHLGTYNNQHGYIYLYDGTSNTLRSWYDYTGLKFADANGNQTCIYPPEGALGWIKWTSSNVLGASSFALENCSGTIANVAVQLWVDSVNKVACIQGRIRINNFSRTGGGPGVTLRSSFGGRSDQPSWHGGVVCNQNGIIPSETVYLQLDYYGTLHIRTTEAVVNFSGTAMTLIIPQTFFKY